MMFGDIAHFLNIFYEKTILISVLILLPFVLSQVVLAVLNKYFNSLNLVEEKVSVQKYFYTPFLSSVFLITLKLLLPLFQLIGSVQSVLDKFSNIFLILTLTWLLIRFVAFLKLIVLGRFDINNKNNLQQRKVRTQIDFIERLLVIFLFGVAFSAILLSFDGARKIGTSLIASAGLVSIITGFAAQKTLSNLIAGFQIAFTQPLRIDDVVVVDGEWGRIEEITLTYIVIKIWDLRRLVVPINYLLEKPFQNWTRTSSDLLGYVYVYADYSLNIDELRQEFFEILNRTQLWDKNIAGIQVTEASEKTIQLRALMSAKDAGQIWDLRCYIREELIKFIQARHPECLPKFRVESSSEDISCPGDLLENNG